MPPAYTNTLAVDNVGNYRAVIGYDKTAGGLRLDIYPTPSRQRFIYYKDFYYN